MFSEDFFSSGFPSIPIAIVAGTANGNLITWDSYTVDSWRTNLKIVGTKWALHCVNILCHLFSPNGGAKPEQPTGQRSALAAGWGLIKILKPSRTN